MNVGSKFQDNDIAEINRASVHEQWVGGASTRTFTKAEGYPKGIRVDVAGTLIMTDWQSSPVSVTWNVLKGEMLPFIPQTINTASTATVIILW